MSKLTKGTTNSKMQLQEVATFPSLWARQNHC